MPKENARSWYKETMTNSTANFSKPQASQASFPVPLEVPPPPHTHMQTHSSSVAVCTAPLFLLSFSKSRQLQQCRMIPLRNTEHTGRSWRCLSFIHGMVSTCVQTQCKHLRQTVLQILIFHFYWVTIWLITIASVRLFSLIKWDS